MKRPKPWQLALAVLVLALAIALFQRLGAKAIAVLAVIAVLALLVRAVMKGSRGRPPTAPEPEPAAPKDRRGRPNPYAHAGDIVEHEVRVDGRSVDEAMHIDVTMWGGVIFAVANQRKLVIVLPLRQPPRAALIERDARLDAVADIIVWNRGHEGALAGSLVAARARKSSVWVLEPDARIDRGGLLATPLGLRAERAEAHAVATPETRALEPTQRLAGLAVEPHGEGLVVTFRGTRCLVGPALSLRALFELGVDFGAGSISILETPSTDGTLYPRLPTFALGSGIVGDRTDLALRMLHLFHVVTLVTPLDPLAPPEPGVATVRDHVARGDFDEAERIAKGLFDSGRASPDEGAIHHQLAMAALMRGDAVAAEAALERAVTEHYPEAMMSLSQLHASRGDERARALAHRAFAVLGDAAAVRTMVLVELRLAATRATAEATFEDLERGRAILAEQGTWLGPDEHDALALALHGEATLSEAHTFPSHAAHLRAIAQALVDEGHPDEALPLLRRAVVLAPSEANEAALDALVAARVGAPGA